ncbi:hypothetical protein [Fictibacillus fluitans]|uniref:Uncharacterized protein n=1 Tax=Fictibacillus fluitans TaxID=3058422 RepID=A0ABT8I0C4_9BACL|nr:hypothetical protein [Fictibacillus sp. NE201]MDN4526479.1 hypothetical protein [Fictibacillus sp. NE201]
MVYQLSAEELIFSFIMSEKMDEAKQLRDQLYSEEQEELFSVRLDAAANGLLSKNLIHLTAPNQGELNTAYEELLHHMSESRRIIRSSWIENEQETVQAFYFNGNQTLKHVTNYGGLAHELQAVSDWRSELLDFIDFRPTENPLFQLPLPEEEFDRILEHAQREDADGVRGLLAQRSDSDNEVNALAKDFAASKGILGSIFMISFNEHKQNEGVKSYLYLKGSQHTWLMTHDEEQPIITIEYFHQGILE